MCFGFVSDLRRSPRIKNFARRHSNTFYSSSQPRSRNLDRALTASQLTLSDSKISGVNVKAVRSPMRLLFGAASPGRPSDQCHATRATRSRLFTDSSVFEVSTLFNIVVHRTHYMQLDDERGHLKQFPGHNEIQSLYSSILCKKVQNDESIISFSRQFIFSCAGEIYFHVKPCLYNKYVNTSV